MGLMTRVASAKKGTKSLKTTVPEGIAEFLGIVRQGSTRMEDGYT